jgi:hypothetical protein
MVEVVLQRCIFYQVCRRPVLLQLLQRAKDAYQCMECGAAASPPQPKATACGTEVGALEASNNRPLLTGPAPAGAGGDEGISVYLQYVLR